MSSPAKKIVTATASKNPVQTVVRNNRPKPTTAAKPKLSVVTSSKFENKQLSAKASALEKSRGAKFVCDTDWTISFANEKALEALEAMESDLHAAGGDWKMFNAGAVVGESLELFFTDEAQEFKRATDVRQMPYQKLIKLGSHFCEFYVDALEDEKGDISGYLVDWSDVTERVTEEASYRATVTEIADRMEMLRGVCITGLADGISAMAAGDLTIEVVPKTPHLTIPPQEELALIASTFNQIQTKMVETIGGYNNAKKSLGSLIAQAQIAVTSIVDASNEVMTGNDDLAQRTEEQAASLEETASSMEEMTSTVKQNADNAKQANQLAMQARESAEKGGQVVNNAVSTMEEINVASKRIADIISVIDEIAFQTNLLALNAAVEAARVGEQGRGFAVVAAEVRNLAGRSATAAKEIKGLVQDSVQKVQEGSTLVNQSGTQLHEIVTSVKKVADIIAEITAAAQEQSAGIEQVNRAIVQMDQITQQNAALVEEASAASQSMNGQAGDLQTVIERFTIDEALFAQLQSKLLADQAAAGAAAKRASKTEPSHRSGGAVSRAARPTRAAAAAPSSKQAAGDLDDFEEF